MKKLTINSILSYLSIAHTDALNREDEKVSAAILEAMRMLKKMETKKLSWKIQLKLLVWVTNLLNAAVACMGSVAAFGVLRFCVTGDWRSALLVIVAVVGAYIMAKIAIYLLNYA